MDQFKLHLGDCVEVMKAMPDNCIDLILTDPPYFKVKGEPWDNQWAKPSQFLTWLDTVLEQFQRILKPNGSLYLFASNKMASRVECLTSNRFRILNHIAWVKPDAAGAEKGARAGITRSYVPQTERIIFASHANPLGDALRTAMMVAGLSISQLGKLALGRNTGLISLWLGDREAHGACQPTCADWLKVMRACEVNVTDQDYDALCRPFSPGEMFSEVWDFQPVRHYPGKHPCEKPAAMLEHIITASSRPGAVVFDGFAGSGSTAIAALKLGRQFIGAEMSERHHAEAIGRIRESVSPSPQTDLFAA